LRAASREAAKLIAEPVDQANTIPGRGAGGKRQLPSTCRVSLEAHV